MSDDKTLAVYDEQVENYVKMSKKLYERCELEAFSGTLTKGAKVLDLGCGPGHYAGWLADQGFEVEAWDGSAEMVAARPLTGIGLNTFPLVYGQDPEYPDVYVYQGYAHAHSTLLQAALDYGLMGFSAVAGLGAALAWATLRARRRLRGTPLDAAVMGLVCAGFWVARQGLLPRINRHRDAGLAGDAAAARRFERLHRLSVALNATQIVVVLVVLVRFVPR